MGRSQETFGKKEVKKRQEQKRKVKEQKRSKKKTEGKRTNFDDMIAYVDEYGMITSTPPDPDKKSIVIAENIELKITKNKPDSVPDYVRKGVVLYFDESKGYGFIRDMESNLKVFVHANNLLEPIKENNIVVFESSKGPKGISASKVKLYKENKQEG
jgi:cold shock CspA family protein